MRYFEFVGAVEYFDFEGEFRDGFEHQAVEEFHGSRFFLLEDEALVVVVFDFELAGLLGSY